MRLLNTWELGRLGRRVPSASCKHDQTSKWTSIMGQFLKRLGFREAGDWHRAVFSGQFLRLRLDDGSGWESSLDNRKHRSSHCWRKPRNTRSVITFLPCSVAPGCSAPSFGAALQLRFWIFPPIRGALNIPQNRTLIVGTPQAGYPHFRKPPPPPIWERF